MVFSLCGLLRREGKKGMIDSTSEIGDEAFGLLGVFLDGGKSGGACILMCFGGRFVGRCACLVVCAKRKKEKLKVKNTAASFAFLCACGKVKSFNTR